MIIESDRRGGVISKSLTDHFNQDNISEKNLSDEVLLRVKSRLDKRLKNIAPQITGNKQIFLEEMMYHYKMLETLEAQYLKEFGIRH